MRTHLSIALLFCMAASATACGPGDRSDDGQEGGSGSDVTVHAATLTGKVYAPNFAPGDVAPGQEIPVFGALVYLTDTRPEPIPDHVYCEACIDAPQGSTLTSHDGSFALPATAGHYWLVIKKGQFRLEQELDVVAGTNALGASVTTLPSKMDPDHGAWIPKIAIARGNFDAVEDILGKIGFGTMSGNKLGSTVGENNHPEITFFSWDVASAAPSSVNQLVTNLAEMEKFHIIFFPCESSVDSTLMSDPAVLKNLRTYVAHGGRVYVTDWSGEMGDRAFPPQLEFGDAGADTIGTYDPYTFDGTITTTGDADGIKYTAQDGKAVDPDLNAWLGLQVGPEESDATPHLYNPNAFAVTDNWNWIAKLHVVMKGKDAQDMPIYDEPKAWVTGSDPSTSNGAHPLAVTYEPAGCGKVLYSTFQTSGATAAASHAGLMPQERVLLFLILEISACATNPVLL